MTTLPEILDRIRDGAAPRDLESDQLEFKQEESALALPDAVMARPTGVGSALTAYEMPIEGRDEWLAAVARLA